MSSLPKHIIDSLRGGTTSLHNSPLLEPIQVKDFFIKELSNGFEKLNLIDNGKNIIGDYVCKLNDSLKQCKTIENDCCDFLVKLVQDVVTKKLFSEQISNITLALDLCKELNENNTYNEYDPKLEYTFKDLKELDEITKEIYKRRFLNVLISGFACYYSNNYNLYLVDLFSLNKDLPSIYSDINLYNTKLLYLCNDLENDGIVDTSNVSFSTNGDDVKIEVSAYTFHSLLYETIRGILEYCISKNQIENLDKFKYVSERTDHKVFDLWDMRLGLPIVNSITRISEEENINILEIGLDRFIELLSEVDVELLFSFFKELLSNTSKGRKLLVDILNFLNNLK